MEAECHMFALNILELSFRQKPFVIATTQLHTNISRAYISTIERLGNTCVAMMCIHDQDTTLRVERFI